MDKDTVTLTRQEYQDLIDTRDGLLALDRIARGETETLSEAETDEYLAAPSPIAFWRHRRGMSEAGLAERAGLSPSHLAEAEQGQRGLGVGAYARLARALRVRIDDLVSDRDSEPD